MPLVRRPAVAGKFYPAAAGRLRQMTRGFLEATDGGETAVSPHALIAPHAGYRYSGSIAASAYARLVDASPIRRVVLLGPAHWVAVAGLAASSATAFATPLGEVTVEREAIEQVLALPQVLTSDEAHEPEHGLEVQLPFLQLQLDAFQIVPFVVGETTGEAVAEVLRQLWVDGETLIVVSSDLSHYHDYATAQRLDRETAVAIEQRRPEKLRSDAACGRVPIQGLLHLAREKGWRGETADFRPRLSTPRTT